MPFPASDEICCSSISGVLTGIGAATEFSAGVSFWNKYGRVLYNAAPGQVAYNGSFNNGTARPKPVLRTTSQSRIENSQINWALGFFGPSFEATPNPSFSDAQSLFNVVIIPEGGKYSILHPCLVWFSLVNPRNREQHSRIIRLMLQ